jgi:uncharacterized membrane protein
VLISAVDDRVEQPQGVLPAPAAPGHQVLRAEAGSDGDRTQ